MNEEKLGILYNQIAQTVIETIPEGWSKVFVYGEITEDVRKSYFYYYPTNRDIPVHSHDIPERFGVDRSEYRKLWRGLLDDLQELRHEFILAGEKVWSSLTFIFDMSGDFKIDFEYSDLSEANDYERRVVWEYKYLRLTPNDAYAKKILQNYLDETDK